MSLTVRRASECDIPAMLRLWREMMDWHAAVEPRFRPLPCPGGERAWEDHLRRDIWENQDWCVFVAEMDGKLVGQIIGWVRDPVPVFEPVRYGYITDAVVTNSARRQGVGQALFSALKAWFREQGVTTLQLQIAHNNPTAQAFWRAMGGTDYMHTLWCDLEEE